MSDITPVSRTAEEWRVVESAASEVFLTAPEPFYTAFMAYRDAALRERHAGTCAVSFSAEALSQLRALQSERAEWKATERAYLERIERADEAERRGLSETVAT